MDRLTKWEYGERTLNCNNCPMQGDCDDSRDCVEVLLERLTAYEDTGLTAGEIVSLKTENATLKKKLDMAIKDLQGDCFACANKDECKKYPCYCFEGSAFKWRGEDGVKNV